MPFYCYKVIRLDGRIDLINMKAQVKLVSKFARKHPSWQTNRAAVLERASGVCELCGKHADLEVHHKLPVWYLATLWCEKACESKEWASRAYYKDYSRWNGTNNLIALCHHCHLQEQQAEQQRLGKALFDTGRFVCSREQWDAIQSGGVPIYHPL